MFELLGSRKIIDSIPRNPTFRFPRNRNVGSQGFNNIGSLEMELKLKPEPETEKHTAFSLAA